MNKTFLKVGQVKVENGYLVKTEGEMVPVFHPEFVDAQLEADFIIKFAEAAKSKDFVGKQADSLEQFQKEFADKYNSTQVVEHITAPRKPSNKLNKQLAEEALAQINYSEKVSNVNKINKFLQQFNVIRDFEGYVDKNGNKVEGGLYFIEEVVRLPKIYTMKEITSAVKSCIDLI